MQDIHRLNFINPSDGYPTDIRQIPAPPPLFAAEIRPDLQNSVQAFFEEKNGYPPEGFTNFGPRVLPKIKAS